LKVGASGLAGAALLGLAGCGGQQNAGATELVFSASPDDTGTARRLVQRFNEQNKGNFQVVYREGAADTGQRCRTRPAPGYIARSVRLHHLPQPSVEITSIVKNLPFL
jgi:ABC-type glycerol-3-phosphate transport system substrate-binding protein